MSYIIKFDDILEEAEFDDENSTLLRNYVDVHDKTSFNKFLRHKKLHGKRFLNIHTIPEIIYRQIRTNWKNLNRVLPDWDKQESFYNIPKNIKWRSWSKEQRAAQEYSQKGDMTFLLSYSPRYGDNILDLTQFPEYEYSQYKDEQEVLCRPTGNVEILKRNFGNIESALYSASHYFKTYKEDNKKFSYTKDAILLKSRQYMINDNKNIPFNILSKIYDVLKKEEHYKELFI